ncbi:MAG: type VI secretion protein, partial [Stackebrandtia sp.]
MKAIVDYIALSSIVVALVTTVAVAGVVMAWSAWTTHRHGGAGNLVRIAAPPQAEPAGAALLWGNLSGLAVPWWRRLAWGQPHLVFEYAFSGRVADVRIWVPASVPVRLVEKAVAAAWPG